MMGRVWNIEADGKVIIPSEITVSECEQTLVVTEISENAFANNKKLLKARGCGSKVTISK